MSSSCNQILFSFRMSEKAGLPPEFLCKICTDIIKNAVMMPCCAGPCCDTCARTGVTCFGTCPLCQEVASVEDLIPYRMLRGKIDDYINKKSQAEKSSLPSSSKRLPDLVPQGITPPRPSELSSPCSSRNIVSVLSTHSRSPSLSSLSSFHSPKSWSSRLASPAPATHLSRSPGIWSLSVPPPGYPPRIQRQDDTLAQFEDAMRNIDAQKRARKIVANALRTKANTNKNFAVSCENGVLSIKEVPTPSSSTQHQPVKPQIRDQFNPGGINQSEEIEGLVDVSEEEEEIKEDDEEGVHCSSAEVEDDPDNVKERNSKHVLPSGYIVQDPQAIAELKLSRSNSLNNNDASNDPDTRTSLQKALDNMKRLDDEKLKEMKQTLEEMTKMTKEESKEKKSKKEKKKKSKKDKMAKAERKLRKLLKKNKFEAKDLSKLLKEKKKKRKKSKSRESSVTEEDHLSQRAGSEPRRERIPGHKRTVESKRGNIQVLSSDIIFNHLIIFILRLTYYSRGTPQFLLRVLLFTINILDPGLIPLIF